MVSICFAIYLSIGFISMIWITSGQTFEDSVQEAFPEGMTPQTIFNLMVTYLFVIIAWPYIMYATIAAVSDTVE